MDNDTVGNKAQDNLVVRSIDRRSFHLMAAGAAATLASAGLAHAAQYPDHPIRVIVPFGPGGGTDLIAREVGKKLGDLLGQNVIVENHGGGNTIVGTAMVAQARPDGYTLLLASNTFTLNPTLHTNLPYDTLKDFTPLSICAVYPFVLVVTPSFPASSVAELVAYAKANPGKINFATAGVGTGNDLATDLFMNKAGIKMTRVPYDSTGASIPDLLSGRVQMEIIPVSLVLQYIQSGTLRALGVGNTSRIALLPNVPTIAETVPGYEADEWNGFAVRSGVPPAILQTLNTALGTVVKDPEIIKAFAAAGASPMYMSLDDASQFISGEVPKWHDVLISIGIKPTAD